jgi:hypothetical protein
MYINPILNSKPESASIRVIRGKGLAGQGGIISGVPLMRVIEKDALAR